MHYDPEGLLQVAMNIEARAIGVPTGLQDYRPALYGGIAAVELEADGVRRVPLSVDLGELQQRIVLCYTGEPRNSGTNNWEITKRHIDGDRFIFDCFERIRDTAADMREALQRGDWDAVGRPSPRVANRKQLAPGVTTPAIDNLISRASAAAPRRESLRRRRRGCSSATVRPRRARRIKTALSGGGAVCSILVRAPRSRPG